MADTRILVVNPNSSEVRMGDVSGLASRLTAAQLTLQSITAGLASSLEAVQPAGVRLSFLTGSSQCPPSINDAPTSIQSAQAVYAQIAKSSSLSPLAYSTDAILICCFSDHPLVAMLRHRYPSLPCMHILESAISAALSSSQRPFAILTTGADMVHDIDRGVLGFMGGVSARYAGCLATNLGVLELRDENSQEKVHRVIKEKVAELGHRGVGAIVLGCAGMAGMEPYIRECLTASIGDNAASAVAIIDGAKAGIHLLAGMARCNFTS